MPVAYICIYYNRKRIFLLEMHKKAFADWARMGSLQRFPEPPAGLKGLRGRRGQRRGREGTKGGLTRGIVLAPSTNF